jgi:hypothetical protein
VSPAREELRRLADAFWKQKAQSDNWWIGEYIHKVVKRNHEDKDRVLDLACELTEDEWAPLRGHLSQHYFFSDNEWMKAECIEQQRVRMRVAHDIDLLRSFS